MVNDILKGQAYGMVTQSVMRSKKITSGAKSLYAYIQSFTGAGTTAFPAQKMIAEEMQVTERTVRNWTKELEGVGVLVVRKRKNLSGYFFNEYETIPYTEKQPETDFRRKSISELPEIKDYTTGNERPITSNNNSNSKNNKDSANAPAKPKQPNQEKKSYPKDWYNSVFDCFGENMKDIYNTEYIDNWGRCRADLKRMFDAGVKPEDINKSIPAFLRIGQTGSARERQYWSGQRTIPALCRNWNHEELISARRSDSGTKPGVERWM